jgi:AMP-polyphosphate phosphotransferase
MFETAELGRKMSKEEYQAELPKIRSELLQAQFALRQTKIPVIVVIAGADGAGKGDTVNALHEWLDPRGLETNVFGPLSDEERDRPPFWRFWRTLPGRGRIGMLFGSWYTDPIIQRTYGNTKTSALDQEMARIAFFEQMLAEDGALMLKFWFHLSKEAQRKRLKKLEKNPRTAWRVSPLDWKHFKLYDRFVEFSERSLRRTDTGYAPWTLIEAADDRYRDIAVGRKLLDALQERLSEKREARPSIAVSPAILSSRTADVSGKTILDGIDLTKKVTPEEYDQKFDKYQARLSKLVRAANEKRRSSVVMFEGWDASGKGGAIRRLTAAMDARFYRVIPIAAPTDEERAHHYLWRFWRHIPRAGFVTLYDRSWYGRVLVERVEGFAREDEWGRAYAEINNFEQQLVEHGIIVTKFWIHISKDEQLQRFEQRKQIAYKQHKITDEDWRNREKWDAYGAAVNDMVERTSTSWAPWTLIAGNDKKNGRIEVLKTFCDRLEAAL